MTPAARVAAAIGVIDDWIGEVDGLDHCLRDWGRASRYAGSGDRRAVADLVYDAIRRRRSAAWRMGLEAEAASGRALMLGALALGGGDPGAVFTGEGHAPAPLTVQEQERLAEVPPEAPAAVRLDVEDWQLPLFGDVPEAAIAALGQRAPLDLRVNRLKAEPEAAAAALAEDGIATEPGPLSPDCLRVTGSQHRVRGARAYLDGLVEIQDAASQAVAAFAAARPGETVLDLCAGGGGKTLAMAAMMGGRGRLMAYDIAPTRLVPLSERAERAGARVEMLGPDDLLGLVGVCDLVLVDAPCSGSGAWRRNPDARWRLTRARLDELCATQAALIDQAARLAAPRGRVVYATCSMFACENDERIDGFLAQAPNWCATGRLRLTPLDGGDGFYAASAERRGPREH